MQEKIHFALVDFQLVLSLLINYELSFIHKLSFIHNTYVHSWFKWYMKQMIKQWPKQNWSYNTVHQQNTTCQGIRHETETYHNGSAFQD